MNDAPSIPSVRACSSAPSNTGSPVAFWKSATSTDSGSRAATGAGSAPRDSAHHATPAMASSAAAAPPSTTRRGSPGAAAAGTGSG